jgi:hypothetical protein
MLLLIFQGTLVSGNVTFFVLVMDGIAFSVSLGLFLALHHGRFRLARLGLVLIGLALVAALLVVQGARDPNTASFMILIFLAGLLFDMQWKVVLTVLSSLVVAGMVLGETHGLLPRPATSVSMAVWLVCTTCSSGLAP